jgi:hypothetical protein
MKDSTHVTARSAQVASLSSAGGNEQVGGRAYLPILAVVAVAVGTIALLVIVSPGLWFYNDEWVFIRERSLTADGLLEAHNEHFSAVLVLLFRGLIELAGTTSYAPFLAMSWATHLLAAATVFVLLREDGTDWQASAGSILFLVPGAGGFNLLAAFQVGFMLATATGCLALAIAPRRPGVAAGLLGISIATQGVGLFYLIATAVRLLGDRRVVWLAVPAAVYSAWFLAYGASAVGTHGEGNPAAVPAYVLRGVTAGFAGLVGSASFLIGLALVALAALLIRRRAFDRLVLASAGGLASMFLVTGLVRAQFGVEQAAASRYVTVAMPFVLVVVMAAWRSGRERYPIARLGPVLVVIAVVLSLVGFAGIRASWDEKLATDPQRTEAPTP